MGVVIGGGIGTSIVFARVSSGVERVTLLEGPAPYALRRENHVEPTR